jgi:hypothetical protein
MEHNGLTCVERLVFESIHRGNQDISQIIHDSGLSLSTINHIIQYLLMRGLILKIDQIYSINPHLNPYLLDDLNQSQKFEMMELIEGVLKTQKKLKMSKFYLTPKDEPIFKALLKNLEKFIEELPPAPTHISTKDHRFFVWGGDQYGNIIQNLLTGVMA